MHSLWLIALTFSAPGELGQRPLTLKEAVAAALKREPELMKARLVQERAQLATLRAQLDRFSLKVDAQLQELWVKSNIGGTRGESINGGLGLSNVSANLSVPIFSGLRVESNVDRTKLLERAAEQDLSEVQRLTALSVARAYWTVKRVELLLEVEQDALLRLGSAEATARARVDAGIAPPIDQNRAAAQRLLQETRLRDLEGQLLQARARLFTLLGLEDVYLLDETRPRQRPPALEELLTAAERHRPQLKAARARARAGRETVAMAMSGYYPQLSAYSLFQYGNNPFLAGAGARAVFGSVNPFDQMAGDFQVGVTLSINLFDTLNTYTAVKDAELEASWLDRETSRVGRLIEGEVRDAHAQVSRLFELLVSLDPAKALALDNLQINRSRYETGEALVFELLDSEIELLNIERQISSAEAELTLAWLNLEASVGEIVGEQP